MSKAEREAQARAFASTWELLVADESFERLEPSEDSKSIKIF